MGCVQSTGVDDEAKARAYLCPFFGFRSSLRTSQAMTRLRTSSRKTVWWPRMKLRCCYLVLESLARRARLIFVFIIFTEHTFLQQSTVLKQMKLIHHGGYNEQERESYKEIIYSNTIQSMRLVILVWSRFILTKCYYILGLSSKHYLSSTCSSTLRTMHGVPRSLLCHPKLNQTFCLLTWPMRSDLFGVILLLRRRSGALENSSLMTQRSITSMPLIAWHPMVTCQPIKIYLGVEWRQPVSRRRHLKLASWRTDCSTSEVSAVNVRSGYTASRTSPP